MQLFYNYRILRSSGGRAESLRVGSENMENLMTVVDRLDELQASSVSRRECSSTRQRKGGKTHGRPCRHIESALPTGDGLWPLPRHMWWRSRKVAAFARLYVFGGLCVDMWRLVHQWWFLLFWLFLTNGTLYQSSKTLKTIGVQIVTGLPRLYQLCTNRQKQSKTVKRQSKQQKWGVKVKGLRDWG